MRVVLYEPEIPPNTGNVARLCAAMNVELNLVEPLGFRLDDSKLKRAGLDYWPNVQLRIWPDWASFVSANADARRLITSSAKQGPKSVPLQDFSFEAQDILLFGPETRGLPLEIINQGAACVHIPIAGMADGGVRSLNLATAAGIVLFTALSSCSMLPGQSETQESNGSS